MAAQSPGERVRVLMDAPLEVLDAAQQTLTIHSLQTISSTRRGGRCCSRLGLHLEQVMSSTTWKVDTPLRN